MVVVVRDKAVLPWNVFLLYSGSGVRKITVIEEFTILPPKDINCIYSMLYTLEALAEQYLTGFYRFLDLVGAQDISKI